MRSVLKIFLASLFVFLSMILFYIFPSSVNAATYYVAGDIGSDAYTSAQATNSATPWLTIQKAATNSAAGDTINVKGGITYSTASTCSYFTAVVCITKSGTEGNFITYQPWPGTGTPIVDGLTTSRGFSVVSTAANYTKFNGFIVKDTTDAFFFSGINIFITNNIIYDSSVTSSHYGVSGNMTAETDTIYIYNNTIYQKETGIHIDKGKAYIKNNIIVNGTNGIASNSGMYVYLDVDYNNVYGNTVNFAVGHLSRPGHDLTLDPVFTDASNRDFTLQSSSPLIDAGATFADVPADIAGTSRPQGNAYDMGVYESSYSQSSPPNASAATFYTAPINAMSLLASYTGEVQLSQFGMRNSYSSTLIGDVNEDGYGDLMIGARHTTPKGSFFIFKGKAEPQTTNAASADIIIRAASSTTLSDNASLGDINNDSHKELLITDYSLNSAYIYVTGTSFSPINVASASATITGPSGKAFGAGSTILGDINGSGYESYIIFASGNNTAYLYYGNATLSNKTYLQADVTFSTGGIVYFTRPGDVNGDGYKDVVFGCPSCSSYKGAVYIFYGGPALASKGSSVTLSQADVILTGDTGVYYLGNWNALSDVNGDGFDDILTVSLNKTYVFFGGTGLTSKTSSQASLVFIGNSTNLGCQNFLGFAVESGDVNNDGYKDVITSDNCLPSTFVFYGGPGITSKDASQADLVFDYIESERGYFGGPITTGDVNGDGYIEIAAGNGQYNMRQGKVWLFAPPHGSPSISVTGIANSDGNPGAVLRGTVSDTLPVGGVEYSFDGGLWTACSGASSFSCTLPESAKGSSHSVTLRSKSSLGIYALSGSYQTAAFRYYSRAGVDVCTKEAPSLAPTLMSAAVLNDSSVLLKFMNNSANYDHLVLEYGTKQGVYDYSADNIYDSGSGMFSYSIGSLIPDTIYHFRIRNGNGCAVGAWSNEITAKTLASGEVNNSLAESLKSLPVKEIKQGSNSNTTQNFQVGGSQPTESVSVHKNFLQIILDFFRKILHINTT